MKKIFAIALAVVMVLSMASAFASNCTAGFDWTCATSVNKCGKATVEVIPYVKANDSCGGVKWVPNTCAGAVNTDVVHYVVKMSVDANPDKEWFDAATFSLTAKGLADGTADAAAKTAYTFTGTKGNFANVEFTGDNAAKAQVYYLNANKGWTRYDAEDENTAEDKFVQTLNVFDAPKAKLCATIKSENAFEAGVVGDYYVMYTEAAGAVEAADAWVTATVKTSAYDKIVAHKDWTILAVVYDGANSVVTAVPKAETPIKDKAYFTANPANSIVTFTKGSTAVTKGVTYDYEEQVEAVAGTETQLVVLDKKGGKPLVTYTIVDGKVRTIKNTPVCGEAEYATIKAFFGLEIGTCVDKDLIKANFGWKDKVEHCATWSDKAVAVVDAECVVAIPKTGDASVLAWLF